MAERCISPKRRKIEGEDDIDRTELVFGSTCQRDANVSIIPKFFDERNQTSMVAEACARYKEFASLPKITEASLLKCHIKGNYTECMVMALMSQHDLLNKEIVKFEQISKVTCSWSETYLVETYSFPSRIQELILQSTSRDGKSKAIIRKQAKTEKAKFFIEIWSESSLQKAICLSDFDLHGDIYSDITFSGLKWSKDNKKLVYIAEKKKKDSKSYFELKKDAVKEGKDEDVVKGDNYLYEEDWGEQKNELCMPVLVVVDVVEEEVSVIKGIPKHISPGQPIWGTGDSTHDVIFFVGWWNEPFKLGLAYCENRRSAICEVKFNSSDCKFRQLSDDNCAVHSPVLSPSGSKLIFLERDEGGPHRGCQRLMMCKLQPETECITVYDIVQKASDTQIPLFSLSLIQNCWLNGDDVVVLHTNFATNQVIVMIEVATGKLYQVTHLDGCWSLLDTCENILLASFSSPVVSDILMIGKCQSLGKICWIEIRKDVTPQSLFLKGNVTWEKFTVGLDDKNQENLTESVLLFPSNASKEDQVPLIVWPHGGPHSCAIAAYSAYPTTFVALGFAVLLANYRGSTGFGEENIKGLLGKIGSQDLQDVQTIAVAALRTGRFDSGRIFAFGGSHGGFLVSHLVAKYPGFYRACALRNPVINIPAMAETTDIPDWCYVESGISYSHDVLPTKEHYCKMLEKSPILHVKDINCPVLIMVGGKDCRVPPQQGKSLYRALKAMSKIVRMQWYTDDCHPLSQVETETDVFINVTKWFFRSA